MSRIFEFPLLKKIQSNNTIQKIVIVILYILFFILSFLIFALEKLRPFNYIIIGVWILISIIAVLYILIYGKIKWSSYIFLSIIFIVLQILSWVLNGFKTFNYTGILLGIMSIFIFELASQKGFKDVVFINIILVSTWLFLIFFIVFYFSNIKSFEPGTKLQLLFGNSNDIARSISYSFLFNYAFVFAGKKWYLKIPLLSFSILSILLIFLIGSVSNLLTCFVVLLLTPLLLLKKKYKIVFGIISVGLIVLFIVSLKLPFMAYFNKRINGMIASFTGNGSIGDDSFAYRFRGAYYAFQMFLKHPFFGWGFDSVFNNYVIMSHNNAAEIASDFGIFALVIEEYFILCPLYLALSKKVNNSTKKSFIVTTLAFMFLFQLFLVSFNSKIECIILPLCFASLPPLIERKTQKYDYYRIDI